MKIDAAGLDFKTLCQKVKGAGNGPIEVRGCMGQRYIGAGMKDAQIALWGTPGNGLGACFDGKKITVYGNAQDAAGDTMNDGRIAIHGSAGDAAGYAMRGGKIYIRSGKAPEFLPRQVMAEAPSAEELKEIASLTEAFAEEFGFESKRILDHSFICLKPDSKNPYKQLYTHN